MTLPITSDTAGDKDSSRFLWHGDANETFSDWTLEIVSDKIEENEVAGNVTDVSPSSNSIHTDEKAIQTYFVHRNILGCGPRKSEYFSKQFHHARDGNCEESKSQTSRIEFPSVAAAAIPVLLDYLYCPDVRIEEINDVGTLIGLHYLSDYFDIGNLRKESFEKIKKVTDYASLNEIYSYAALVVDDAVINFVAEYVSKHLATKIFPLQALVEIAGCDFWSKVASFFQKEPVKDIHKSWRWSEVIFDLSKHHSGDLTYELFKEMTATEVLPYVRSNVALSLLELEPDSNANLCRSIPTNKKRFVPLKTVAAMP